MRKIALIFLIFALSSQAAFAIIPLLVAGARVVQVALSTTTGQVLLGAPIGIGLAFTALKISRLGTNGSTLNTDLYYTSQPRSPSSVESAAGWTQASSGSSPVPPASAGAPQTLWQMDGSVPGVNSIAGACAAGVTKLNQNTTGYVYSLTSVSGLRCYVYQENYGAAGFFEVVQFTGCPAGYSVSGSNCALSNSSAVSKPADGFCPVVRSGNTYAADSNDPDCATANPSFAADGTWSITGADGTTISSAPTGVTGERKITSVEPNATNNTTHTREITMQDGSTASDSPYIKGVIDKYTQGTGAAATTTPVTPSTTAADNAGVIAAINADQASREAWQAAEPARTAADRQAERAIPSTGEIIPKESIPFAYTPKVFASSAVCPTDISFSMLGKSYVISYQPFCNLMSILRPLFLAIGACAALFIFIGGLKN